MEDTASVAALHETYLGAVGYDCSIAESLQQAEHALQAQWFDLVLLDLQLPDGDGLDLAARLRDGRRAGAVIVVTSDGSIDRAVDAMRRGAQDFLVKPISKSRLLTTVHNVDELVELRREVHALRESTHTSSFQGFLGASAAMQSVYRAIDHVAQSQATVFITGESGTGKEVCANALHRAGPRAAQPFVPLNCGAIPPDLIESELFGHLKGAFTGAIANRPGAALSAHGGTLFLDEICEMEIHLQTKLLRFLQTSMIQPIGANQPRQVDVRVVCATNRDPVQAVREGLLREDLFYRLNVIPIHLPPLRERDGDVLLLAEAFLTRYAAEEGKAFAAFDAEATAKLQAHRWPGNVRELQNVVRHLVVLNDGDVATGPMVHLPGDTPPTTTTVPTGDEHTPPAAELSPPPGAPSVPLGGSLRDIERLAIEGTLCLEGGSVPRAAKRLGVSPSTLYRKMERWRDALGGE